MPREIAFRVWLKYQKEMVNVTTIDFKKGCVLIDKPYFPKIPEYYGTALLFDQIELMQYTGLKDKNGVKIFEGDIIKCKVYAIDNETFEIDDIGEVVYDDDCCAYFKHTLTNLSREPVALVRRYNRIHSVIINGGFKIIKNRKIKVSVIIIEV